MDDTVDGTRFDEYDTADFTMVASRLWGMFGKPWITSFVFCEGGIQKVTNPLELESQPAPHGSTAKTKSCANSIPII